MLAALNSVTGVPEDTATVVLAADDPALLGALLWPVIMRGLLGTVPIDPGASCTVVEGVCAIAAAMTANINTITSVITHHFMTRGPCSSVALVCMVVAAPDQRIHNKLPLASP
jgi:hypothetical protein